MPSIGSRIQRRDDWDWIGSLSSLRTLSVGRSALRAVNSAASPARSASLTGVPSALDVTRSSWLKIPDADGVSHAGETMRQLDVAIDYLATTFPSQPAEFPTASRIQPFAQQTSL